METKKEPGLFDEGKAAMLRGIIEPLIPKITPFVKPMIEDVEKSFGDNEYTVVIRCKKLGAKAEVIFLDNSKDWMISCEGGVKKFTVSEKAAIRNMFGLYDLIMALFSGKAKSLFNTK